MLDLARMTVLHNGVPTLLIVDAKGKVVRRIEGFDTNLPADLRIIVEK